MEVEPSFVVNGAIRLAASAVWLFAFLIFLRSYQRERIHAFRSLRIYAAIICFSWFVLLLYTGVHLMNGWEIIPAVNQGLISAALMFPTAGYLAASAWVTHKVISSWE